MNTLDILNELAATSSRNDKITILKKYEANALFKRVVWLALHPRIQFYIRKIPDYNAEEFGPIQLEWALDQLMRFNTRELTGNSAVSHLAYTLSHLTPANAEVISRILAKDLKCGVDDSSVNKAWPKFIPEYPYMRCLSEFWCVEDEKGNKITIKDVVDNKLKIKIKSYNFLEECVEYREVVNWFNNGYEERDWYIIKWEENGEVFSSQPVTDNHKFIMHNGEEKIVDELCLGDMLI